MNETIENMVETALNTPLIDSTAPEESPTGKIVNSEITLS